MRWLGRSTSTQPPLPSTNSLLFVVLYNCSKTVWELQTLERGHWVDVSLVTGDSVSLCGATNTRWAWSDATLADPVGDCVGLRRTTSSTNCTTNSDSLQMTRYTVFLHCCHMHRVDLSTALSIARVIPHCTHAGWPWHRPSSSHCATGKLPEEDLLRNSHIRNSNNVADPVELRPQNACLQTGVTTLVQWTRSYHLAPVDNEDENLQVVRRVSRTGSSTLSRTTGWRGIVTVWAVISSSIVASYWTRSCPPGGSPCYQCRMWLQSDEKVRLVSSQSPSGGQVAGPCRLSVCVYQGAIFCEKQVTCQCRADCCVSLRNQNRRCGIAAPFLCAM